MKARKAKHGWLLTLIFSVISVLYMYPIILVFINSFKKKAYISRYPFKIATVIQVGFIIGNTTLK